MARDLGDDFGGHFADLRQELVGKAPELDAVFVDQGLEGLAVARGELAEHVVVGRLAGVCDDGLEVCGEGFQGLLVDHAL